MVSGLSRDEPFHLKQGRGDHGLCGGEPGELCGLIEADRGTRKLREERCFIGGERREGRLERKAEVHDLWGHSLENILWPIGEVGPILDQAVSPT